MTMDPVWEAIQQHTDRLKDRQNADLAAFRKKFNCIKNLLIEDLNIGIRNKHFSYVCSSYVEICTKTHESRLPERFRTELEKSLRGFLNEFLRSSKRVEILTLLHDDESGSCSCCFKSDDISRWTVKARLLAKPNETENYVGPEFYKDY